MKKLIALLLVMPSLCFALANDMILMQRNPADTGNITRIIPWTSSDSLFWFDGAAVQPKLVTLGSGLSITAGILDSAPQVQSDWSAVSGLSFIQNKPTIPAAQVNSDWSAVSGVSQILNKPSAASQGSASRTLNTIFQVSATRNALVVYSIQIQVTASIAGGQNGDVILEIASDSGFTTNVQTLAISGVGQTYTLAVALQGVQPQTQPVTGFVPAGYYTRLRTVNNTGTPVFTYRSGQEVLL